MKAATNQFSGNQKLASSFRPWRSGAPPSAVRRHTHTQKTVMGTSGEPQGLHAASHVPNATLNTKAAVLHRLAEKTAPPPTSSAHGTSAPSSETPHDSACGRRPSTPHTHGKANVGTAGREHPAPQELHKNKTLKTDSHAESAAPRKQRHYHRDLLVLGPPCGRADTGAEVQRLLLCPQVLLPHVRTHWGAWTAAPGPGDGAHSQPTWGPAVTGRRCPERGPRHPKGPG